MLTNDVTKKELAEITSTLGKIGFTLDNASEVTGILYFVRLLEDDDRENVLNYLKPNHFQPLGYRSLSFGVDVNGHIYATSSIYGLYRSYRAKNSCSMNFGNIFSYGQFSSIVDTVNRFVEDYTTLKYNRTRTNV